MSVSKQVISNNLCLRAYVIGLALGDGNLSNPNGRAVRLRISCDIKYPDLILKITRSLQELLPQNKIGKIIRKHHCVDISVYSNALESLLGWSATKGSKFIQQANIPEWIFDAVEYEVACLQGLLETDGTVYSYNGYKAIMFTSIIKPLAESVEQLFLHLGFNPHFYIIRPKLSLYQSQVRYNVRLAKDVDAFINLVQFRKS